MKNFEILARRGSGGDELVLLSFLFNVANLLGYLLQSVLVIGILCLEVACEVVSVVVLTRRLKGASRD